jgi:hypothetical protein
MTYPFDVIASFGFDILCDCTRCQINFGFHQEIRLRKRKKTFTTDRLTHLKIGIEYQLFKYLYRSAGSDDFITNQGSSPFAEFPSFLKMTT